jgi:chemotaxis protein MotB
MADERPIIIKKVIKKGGHGHHGGAWKVAYADFVTAMMAFFLLLWLLNATTEEQKKGISNYFAPTSISNSQSGAGGILGGMSLSEVSALKAEQLPPLQPRQTQEGVEAKEATEEDPTRGSKAEGQGIEDEVLREARRAEEARELEQAAAHLRQAIQESPELAELAQNLLVEMTPEGLRIQIIDQDRRPMFASGQVAPLPYTRQLLAKVAEVIQSVPNAISISGHTDAVPFRRADGYSNWELSADRANAVRRILMDVGISAERVLNVTGKADKEPLIKDDPNAASNRRISVTLLYSDISGQTRAPEKPVTPIQGGVFGN